jgi:hypothetical protein
LEAAGKASPQSRAGPAQVTLRVAELIELWDVATALNERIRRMVVQVFDQQTRTPVASPSPVISVVRPLSEEELEVKDIDQAIRAAKRQMQIHSDLQGKYNKTNDGTAARKEFEKHWEWSREHDFLERLKALYESQAGVPLNYTLYPVTKVDPKTGMKGKENPWRLSTKRQPFSQGEANGSFCLGAARSMAFRALFGLDKPRYRAVLTDLKKKIEAAKRRFS